MRMANDRDQAIVRSAVSDAAGSLLGFVPSLGTREVFAFGEGVALPTRLRFNELPAEFIPKSESVGSRRDALGEADEDFLSAVVERWRGATMRSRPKAEDTGDLDALAKQEFSQVRAKPAASPPPVSSLLKPGALDPDSYFFPVQDSAGRPVPRLRK
jgi:hypothetical protein